jgi:hypothetical protein
MAARVINSVRSHQSRTVTPHHAHQTSRDLHTTDVNRGTFVTVESRLKALGLPARRQDPHRNQ